MKPPTEVGFTVHVACHVTSGKLHRWLPCVYASQQTDMRTDHQQNASPADPVPACEAVKVDDARVGGSGKGDGGGGGGGGGGEVREQNWGRRQQRVQREKGMLLYPDLIRRAVYTPTQLNTDSYDQTTVIIAVHNNYTGSTIKRLALYVHNNHAGSTIKIRSLCQYTQYIYTGSTIKRWSLFQYTPTPELRSNHGHCKSTTTTPVLWTLSTMFTYLTTPSLDHMLVSISVHNNYTVTTIK